MFKLKDTVRSLKRVAKDGHPVNRGKGTVIGIDSEDITVRWWQSKATSTVTASSLVKATYPVDWCPR